MSDLDIVYAIAAALEALKERDACYQDCASTPSYHCADKDDELNKAAKVLADELRRLLRRIDA